MLKQSLRTLVLITLCLMLIRPSNEWNARAKCKHAKLLNHQGLNNIYDITDRNKMLTDAFGNIKTNAGGILGYEQNNQNTMVTDMNTVDSTSALGRCKNFIASGQSCCQKDVFQSFLNFLHVFFKYQWDTGIYPAHAFVRQFQLDCGSCYTYGTPINDQVFNILHQKYGKYELQLVEEEKKFLNETACMACLGPKDFNTFLHPNIQYESTAPNILVFEQNYYINKINRYAELLYNLQSLHQQGYTYIRKYNGPLMQKNCPAIYNKYSNKAFYDSLKVCKSLSECRKYAVYYLGQTAAPQILWWIKKKQANKIPVCTDIYLTKTPGFGFRGNTTYQSNYGNLYFPDIKRIKFQSTFSKMNLTNVFPNS